MLKKKKDATERVCDKEISTIRANNIIGPRSKCTSRKKRGSLSVYYANCRSIHNKINDLKALISSNNPDIICLTETWTNTSSKHLLAEIDIPGYNLHKCDRTDKRGGGVAIYIRNSITCHYRSDITSNPANESVWIEITGEGENILL